MFKVGDRVKLISTLGENSGYDKYLNKVGTIESIVFECPSDPHAVVKFDIDGNARCPYLKNLELFKEIKTRSDVKLGDVITLRNGDKLLVISENGRLRDLDVNYNNPVTSLNSFKNDLTSRDGNAFDIVKVERYQATANTIFDRNREPKKMTVSEICKELGYDVEIVKESEEN